ncbi:hypothetical protein [Pseudothauera lacus]|uniref:hypothetical protein n=1 Tax=Pseudothauera lacus TaxID=2136175 RepID=UPI0011B24B8F|nr:hypothetical protein [Pseudothauera lacus]
MSAERLSSPPSRQSSPAAGAPPGSIRDYLPRPLEPWVDEDEALRPAQQPPPPTAMPVAARRLVVLACIWLAFLLMLAFMPVRA